MWLIQRPGSEEVNREFRAGAEGKGERSTVGGGHEWEGLVGYSKELVGGGL